MARTRKPKKIHHEKLNRVEMGIGWYSRQDWERLKQIAADTDRLDDTYDEWVENVENAIETMTEQGLRPQKVPVDLDELITWCREQDRPLDGAARADYAARQLQYMHEVLSDRVLPESQHNQQPLGSRKILDLLEDLFEKSRDASQPFPYPYDKATGTINLPRKEERQLRKLVKRGKKSEAVSIVTKLTGAGLRISKDYVDTFAEDV